VLKAQCIERGLKMKIQLKAARVNANLTQEEVAKSLKISKNSIVNYESYTSVPSVGIAKKLAALYGMRVDDIIWSSEE
jgi:DNA-binding XRE family transcriptional regulator